MDAFFRKSMEATIRAEDFPAEAQEKSPVGFFVAGADGLILDANQVLLGLLGYDAEVLAQGALSCQRIIVGDTWPQIAQTFDQLHTQGYLTPFVADFRCQDGSIITAQVTITALQDGSGRGAFLLQVDDDSKLALAALKRLMEESPNFIVALDNQLRFITFNSAYSQEFKKLYGKEITKGASLVDLLADIPDVQVTFMTCLTRALQGEVFTLRHDPDEQSLDGHLSDITCGPLNDQGKQFGVFYIVWNKSAIHQLESNLRLSDQRFHSIFNSSFQFTCLLAVDGSVSEVNHTALSYGKLRHDDVLGRFFWDCPWWRNFPDTQSQLKHMIQQAARGEMFRVDLTLQGTDGVPAGMDFSLTPLRDRSGKPMEIIVEGWDVTRQKQAHAEILRLNKELEKRFDVTFEQAAVGIAHVGNDQTFLKINQKYCDMLGYTAAELQGKTFSDITYPEDKQENTLTHQKLIRQELEQVRFEKRYIRKDGSLMWGELTTSTVLNEQGQTEYCLTVIVDITERKQFELALRASEERFRMLADVAPIHIYDVTPNGYFRFLNKAALDFHGFIDFQDFQQAEQSVMRVAEQVPVDERGPLLQAFDQAMQNQTSFTWEFHLRRKDGELRWFITYAAPIFYPNGEFYGLVGTATDITERKQIEEALLNSEARWREMANTVPIIIWVADVDGEISFLNERWFQYTGLTLEESIGFGWIRAIHPDEQEKVKAIWMECLEQKSVCETEIRYLSKNGSYRWHLVRAVPILNAEGEIQNWFGTTMDIHDRLMMEHELKVARDMANNANIKKSQFLANMSHELRTPLNAVIGFSDMMKKGLAGDLTEKQSQYIEHIATSGRHLLAMVNDILDIAKAEAGKMEVVLQYVELEPFIEQVKELVLFSANKNKVQLSILLQPGLHGLVADPNRLRQIFVNLISNAIKFNREGGQVMVIMERSPDQHWIICQFQDTGIGIPSDKMDKLFNEFYQVDETNTRQYEGTGLGLALTQKLVALHQGKIDVESREGEGSTFTVKLPVNPYSPQINTGVSNAK